MSIRPNIIIFEILLKIENFVVQPDDEMDSAEEQPASNKAVPIQIIETYMESSIQAAPFIIWKASRLRKLLPSVRKKSFETVSNVVLFIGTKL